MNVQDDSHLYVEDTTFENNKSFVLYSIGKHYDDSYFKNCTFEENKIAETLIEGADNVWPHTFAVGDETLIFIDCKMWDSTYYDQDLMVFEDTDAPNGSKFPASIFGEGSLSMIIAFLSLIVSGVAIFLVVYYNKKKAVPVAAAEADEESLNKNTKGVREIVHPL